MELDWINMGLIGIAVYALFSLFGRKTSKAEKHVDASIHEETRKKANAVIPLVKEGADETLFELQNTPMQIKPTDALKAQSLPAADPVVKDALWVHQRAMLLRLEGELEMAQQAEVSAHFAFAAPANQPDDLVTQACQDAEATRTLFAQSFDAKDIDDYWLGWALVLLLSNRKLFDHVAWLTDAGTERSRTGSYFLDTDGVMLIPIYTTRIADSRRTVLRQLVRTLLHCYARRGGSYPRWVEEGIVRWMEVQKLGAPEKIQPRPQQPNQPPPPPLPPVERILDESAWAHMDDDAILREFLPETSYKVIAWLMRDRKAALVKFLTIYKSNPDEPAAWTQAMGGSADLVEIVRQGASARLPQVNMPSAGVEPGHTILSLDDISK